MRRLKQLEDENAKLKKLVAELCDEWGVSIRRASRTLEATQTTYHYKSRRRDQAVLAARIKEIIQLRVRCGYRRVHVVLRREGWKVNMKQTYRIYKGSGVQLRNKTPKRRVKAKLREDRCPAGRPHEIRSMDFVHDQLANGQKLRVLKVVDTFSRFCPVLDPRSSYRGENVVQTLEHVCGEIGYPQTIRVDQALSSSAVTLICGPTLMG